MKRFLHSGLFPLIVIVLLVYLASQTLLGEDKPTTEVAYSQIVHAVQAESGIRRVVLRRNRSVVLERTDGTSWKATNPSEASQLALERTLIARGITYEWKNTSTSAWWSLLTSLLPFVLLFGFWVHLNNRRDERLRVPGQDLREASR